MARPGDVVWFHADGKERRSVVLKVGRSRILIAIGRSNAERPCEGEMLDEKRARKAGFDHATTFYVDRMRAAPLDVEPYLEPQKRTKHRAMPHRVPPGF